MGRPREFDEAVVLDRARDAFWSHGVAATSISTLSEATGLSVGSIYKAFSSKDQLCARTLEDYVATAQATLRALLAEAPSPWSGIRTWLDTAIDRASDTSSTRGCYAVELATERAATDERIRTTLLDHDRQLVAILTETVRRAVERGEVSGDPDAIARLLLTTVNGLQVDARKGVTAERARSTIDTLLAALET